MMLKEFFSPLWDFLIDKLGTGFLVAGPLIAIILLALAFCALVFILSLPKLIFDEIMASKRKKAALLAEDGAYEEAFRLFEKSGNKAKCSADELYQYAVCLEKTGRKADYWYHLAEEKGSREGTIDYARCNLKLAKEKPHIAVEAVKTLREADSSRAKAILEDFRINGQVQPLYRGALLGEADAQFTCGLNEYRADSETNGIFWLKLAAEQGHKDAADYLGHIYTGGYKTPANYKEAIRWFGKLGNDAEAQYNIAVCYYKLMAQRAKEKNLNSRLERISDYEYLNYSMSYRDYMQRAAANGSEDAKKALL